MNNQTLNLGFAFSLMPDGSPGAYNDRIAESLLAASNNPGLEPEATRYAIQWELADALLQIDPDWFESQQHSGSLFVVEPPAFAVTDVNPERLAASLEQNQGRHSSQLQTCLADTDFSASALNHLLYDHEFAASFAGLNLTSLVRPELGELFTEYRLLPSGRQKLRRYQTKRVNRLIIEAIVQDPEAIGRAKYLSTAGVIKAVLDHWSLTDIKRVIVFAHPAHTPRCLRQTVEVLNAMNAGVDSIVAPLTAETWPWQADVAQVWCRSQDNWLTYEAKVQSLLQNAREARETNLADQST